MFTYMHAGNVSEQAHENLTLGMAPGEGNSVVKRFSREDI